MPKRPVFLTVLLTALLAGNGVAWADGGGRPAALPHLLTLAPIAVPIVDHGEVMGRLELRAMWRARDADALARAEAQAPLLRELLVEAATEHARIDAAPALAVDPRALAERLRQAAAAEGFTGVVVVLEARTRRG